MHATTMPVINVTNYQQYIDAAPLQQLIADSLPDDVSWPDAINVSIAYMQVQKKHSVYITMVALSILGKAYRLTLHHDNEYFYLAQYGLDLNNYSTQAVKDMHIRVFNQAFVEVINVKAAQIMKAIKFAYGKQA